MVSNVSQFCPPTKSWPFLSTSHNLKSHMFQVSSSSMYNGSYCGGDEVVAPPFLSQNKEKGTKNNDHMPNE